MYQMKEQDKTPEKQLNEVEIGNCPEKEGDRQLSRKRIQNNDSEDDPGPKKKNGGKIEKMQEMFNKDLKELKNKTKQKGQR